MLIATILVGLATCAPAWAAESEDKTGKTERPRMRLMLEAGGYSDVLGPVTRKDGRVLFYTLDGTLSSIKDEFVRDVVEAPAKKADAKGKDAPPESYSNADLPEPVAIEEPPAEETAETPAETETAEEPAPEEAAAPEVADPAAESEPAAEEAAEETEVEAEAEPEEPADRPLVPVPTEVDGHDESWWREQVQTMRGGIDELTLHETAIARALVCVQNGVDANSERCFPAEEAPEAGVLPDPATEQALNDRLAEIRTQVTELRAELGDFIDRAMKLGVPTGWLL
jgi:hypothetical protein